MDPGITVADIDLKALAHNLAVVRKKVGQTGILAVVKANAYGHGSVEVSKCLIQNGVTGLGVACADEGITLRNAGITVPVVVFFDRFNTKAFLNYSFTPVVSDYATAKEISDLSRRSNRSTAIHIKVDTGMGRIGLDVQNAEREILRIAALENITLEGLMSHFSDADLKEKEFAHKQRSLFLTLLKKLQEKGITFRYLHMANSAAVMTMPDAHFTMVRPGIMLYGYACCGEDMLMPVMSIRSRIILLKKVPAGTPISYGRTFLTKRESIIATIPAGYADGFSRKLSNNGEVLISGRRAPIVGRVCMDTIMVDVTGIPDVSYDSEAVLLGQQGDERITADAIAERTGTICYEVLTSIGPRVRRVYLNKGARE